MMQSCFVWVHFPHSQDEPLWYDQGRADRTHAVLKLVSITVYECSTWILHFTDVWLAYTILGIDLSVQVSVYIEQFCKITEQIQFALCTVAHLRGRASNWESNNLVCDITMYSPIARSVVLRRRNWIIIDLFGNVFVHNICCQIEALPTTGETVQRANTKMSIHFCRQPLHII